MLTRSQPQPQKSILAGVVYGRQTLAEAKAHMEELAALSFTLGITPVARVLQVLEHPDGRTFLGKGKAEELRALCAAQEAGYVMVDDELTASQIRHLENAVQCQVWDRNMLILHIFAAHASTPQARTQVELAQHQYMLPRLKGLWTHHSRFKGGRGMKGPGEKELETDRRLVQDKIHVLKERLEAIEKQTITQSKQRKERLNVALVGYTNAGKSTLMRRLSHADVLVADQLFATLSTTTRKVVLQQLPFLLSDTVGFIRKLPHGLIECFKATLASVKDADILLLVCDAADPQCISQVQVVEATLQQLGSSAIPTLLLLNKIDKLPGSEKALASLKEQVAAFTTPWEAIVPLSATGEEGALLPLEAALYPLLKRLYQTRYPHILPYLSPLSEEENLAEEEFSEDKEADKRSMQ